jgi:hypothetical protein
MKEIPCQIETWGDVDRMSRAVESVMSSAGLRQMLKGTLRSYPGCVHWHFGKDGATGTLEVTVWPAQRRVWMSVQARRSAGWIENCISQLRVALERELGELSETD